MICRYCNKPISDSDCLEDRFYCDKTDTLNFANLEVCWTLLPLHHLCYYALDEAGQITLFMCSDECAVEHMAHCQQPDHSTIILNCKPKTRTKRRSAA